jgi:hypothetical protein
VKKLLLVTLLMLLIACSANKNIKTELYNDLSAKKAQYSDSTLEDIAKLKPQINPPIKIAVSQPTGHEAWSSEEIQEIESWFLQLKLAGLANEMVVIPRSLQQGCCLKNFDIRTAAAKIQADAVIIVDDSVRTDRYLNPLSFLNITVIAMWIVPGHHRDSYAAFEAALVDTKNGYIYGVTRGDGEEKKIRPFMYADYDTGQSEARMQALKSLGKNIVEKAATTINGKK